MQVKHLQSPKNWVCELCGKKPVSSSTKPHSLKKTKRTLKPNLQKIAGIRVCTGCIRTLKKQKHSL